MSCTKAYPTFASCEAISTTWANTGDFCAMPVFFDLVEYVAVGFGIDWPADWGTGSWVRCKGDLAVGGITNPGEGTGITWTACQNTWSVAPGYIWLAASGAGMVELVADPATGDLGVVDCAPEPRSLPRLPRWHLRRRHRPARPAMTPALFRSCPSPLP